MTQTFSRHLMESSPMLVYPKLAKALGLNESIILQQIEYWLKTSKHIIDGRRWIYNTIEEWAEQFIWCDKRTVRRCLDKLRSCGILLTGNFNKRQADRTLWYSIDYEALDRYVDTVLMEGTKCPDDVDKMSECSIGTKCPDDVDKMCTALPENTTEINTEITQKTTTTTSGGGSCDVAPLDRRVDTDYADVCTAIESNGFGMMTPYVAEQVQQLLTDYPKDWIVDAMKVSISQNKRKLSYTEGILRRWRADGRREREEHSTLGWQNFNTDLPDYMRGDINA